jgi:hypothetical protein
MEAGPATRAREGFVMMTKLEQANETAKRLVKKLIRDGVDSDKVRLAYGDLRHIEYCGREYRDVLTSERVGSLCMDAANLLEIMATEFAEMDEEEWNDAVGTGLLIGSDNEAHTIAVALTTHIRELTTIADSFESMKISYSPFASCTVMFGMVVRMLKDSVAQLAKEELDGGPRQE